MVNGNPPRSQLFGHLRTSLFAVLRSLGHLLCHLFGRGRSWRLLGDGLRFRLLRRPEQGPDRPRRHDLAIVGKGLVVPFDLFQVVAVIDHDAVRLAQPLFRDVAQPIDALQPGAIAEMEARHRVHSRASVDFASMK